MFTEEQEQKIIGLIAYHRSEERKKLQINGSSWNDWKMAEKDLMNYEIFKENYKHIEDIIKGIV